MPSLSDIVETTETPEGAYVPVRCKHCLYFKRAALYSVGGKYVPCSNEAIGRSDSLQPCVNFEFDSLMLKDMRNETASAIFKAVQALARDPLDRNNPSERPSHARKLDNFLDLILAATAIYKTEKAGYSLGKKYEASLADATKTGILVAYNRGMDKAVLLLDTGVTLEIDAGSIVQVSD